jgi:hypothetical protein
VRPNIVSGFKQEFNEYVFKEYHALTKELSKEQKQELQDEWERFFENDDISKIVLLETRIHKAVEQANRVVGLQCLLVFLLTYHGSGEGCKCTW